MVVADAGYGVSTPFRFGLEERGLPYVPALTGKEVAYAEEAEPRRPAYGGLGPPPLPRYHTPPAAISVLQPQTLHHVSYHHHPSAERTDRAPSYSAGGHGQADAADHENRRALPATSAPARFALLVRQGCRQRLFDGEVLADRPRLAPIRRRPSWRSH